jgi:hypothetical protein
MAQKYTREQLVARLVRAGEIEVTGEDIETIGDYFAPGFESTAPVVSSPTSMAFRTTLPRYAQDLTTARSGAGSSSSRGTSSPAKPGLRGPSSASSPRLDTTDASEFCDPTFDTQVAKAAGLQITNPLAADAARP